MSDFVAPAIDWWHLTPVLCVLGAGVVGILVESFVPASVRRRVQAGLALAALVLALAAVVALWPGLLDVTIGPDGTIAGGARAIAGHSVVLTPAGLAGQGILLLLALLGLFVVIDRTSAGQDAFAPQVAAAPGSEYEELARRRGLEQTEVFPLFLFAVGGMAIFPVAADLLTMFIALEVLSLPLYVLCAMARRRRLLSQEASLKYFLLGAFASALFLFGVVLLYGFAGSVHLADIAGAARTGSPLGGDLEPLLVVGVVLVLAGLLFKVGAVPFHAWTPDVYQGAPTPVTGFMAACVKVAAFGALLRVAYLLVPSMPAAQRDAVEVVLWTVAIATMAVGTVVGAVQTDVKRLLAYSSIAHAGFILIGLISWSSRGISATLFYLLAYGLATVGAFAVVTLVRERGLVGGRPSAEDGVALSEATHLSQWAGLGRTSPGLAAAFALFLLSFAGIPLTAGFVGKFSSFTAASASGGTVLAVIGVLASAVAVFFYVRLIVLMFFTPRVDGDAPSPSSAPTGGAGSLGDGAAPRADGTPTGPTADAAPSGALGVLDIPSTMPPHHVVGSTGWTAATVAVCAAGVLLLGVVPGPVLDLLAQGAKFLP